MIEILLTLLGGIGVGVTYYVMNKKLNIANAEIEKHKSVSDKFFDERNAAENKVIEL